MTKTSPRRWKSVGIEQTLAGVLMRLDHLAQRITAPNFLL